MTPTTATSAAADATATATAFPTNQQHKSLVLKSAILSRLLLLTLILIWRSLLTPYDTSAPLNPNCLKIAKDQNSDSAVVLFPKLASAIENGIVWDSVYFVRSAQCSAYEYEQSYAFLPLLPLFISFLSHTGSSHSQFPLSISSSSFFLNFHFDPCIFQICLHFGPCQYQIENS